MDVPVQAVYIVHVYHSHHTYLFTCTYVAFTRENNYLYAIPLKEIYTEKIKIGVKSSLLPYHIPYTKGCHLFCTAPLDGQFLRLAVAVKTKVYMLAYKHPANLTINGSPITPIKSPKPLDNFIKHRVRIWSYCIGCDRDVLHVHVHVHVQLILRTYPCIYFTLGVYHTHTLSRPNLCLCM